MSKIGWLTGFLALVLMSIMACGENPIPRPKGYFRIDLPEKAYRNFDGPCPFSFDIPVYSALELAGDGKDSCRFNLTLPSLRAKLHFTYLPVDGDLSTYMDDAYNLAFQHEVKASAIKRTRIDRSESLVYGLIYDLKGNAASPLQFYVTDSTRHFLRGALYFSTVPNADSIAPVMDFLREDIQHLLNTLEWKDPQ